MASVPTAHTFTKALLSAHTKKIDLTADAIRVLLATAASTALSAPGRNFTDGATTNDSTSLTSAAGATFVTGAGPAGDVGATVTGAGILPGTTIASVTNATTVVLSQPADATASGVTVTLTRTAGALMDTAQFVSDVKASAGFTELATGVGGSNYTQNANSTTSGQAIAAPTFTLAGHVYTLTSATNPAWTTAAAAFNPAFALFYDATPGTDATNPVLGWWDLNGSAASPGNNGPYTLTLSGSGIYTVTAA